MSFQAYLDNAEKQCGRTPLQLIEEAEAKALTGHKEIIGWLKADHGLGHGHANALARVIRKGPEIGDKHVGTTGSHRDESSTLRLTGIGT